MEVNYLGSLFRLKEFSMKNDRLMIKQAEMHDAICVTGSLLCMRAWLHTYACSSWQRRPVRLFSVQHINPPLLGGSHHCLFPQLFTQPFSVLTALLLSKTCLPSWLPGTQKKCSSLKSSAPQPSVQRATASSETQSHITQRILVGDKEKLHKSSWKLDDCSMCSHLSAVIHKSWLTQPGIHPLCAYMCVCECFF